jgi:hypothetical protein
VGNAREEEESGAAEGALWLHCRLQHGPRLCEADCSGEFLHRPEWRPVERRGQMERTPAEPESRNEELRYVGVGHDIWGQG